AEPHAVPQHRQRESGVGVDVHTSRRGGGLARRVQRLAGVTRCAVLLPPEQAHLLRSITSRKPPPTSRPYAHRPVRNAVAVDTDAAPARPSRSATTRPARSAKNRPVARNQDRMRFVTGSFLLLRRA